ncbi:unnamed protein product [Schistosoma mattheei]|uniref:IFT80/172/WDR35 TPR domain-containing protein n=1 Tax=Schistosoma mattheei TaxID=31246 RepID=A0A183NWK3_9TREM|nr:unnamed protein product [Schistosoma mattheei]
MVTGDQRLVHTPFIPAGYWSSCAPLVWDPVKAPDIRFSSSQFRGARRQRVGLPWQRLYMRGRVRAFREGGRAHPTLGHTRAFGGSLNYHGEYQEAEAILLQNHLYFRAIMLNLHAFKWNRALELANKYNLAVDIVLSMRHDYLKQLNRVEELHLFNSQPKQAS